MSTSPEAASGLGRLLPAAVRGRYAVKFGIALLAIVVVVGAVSASIFVDTQHTVGQQTEEELRGIAVLEAHAVADWKASKESSTAFLAAALADQPADTSALDHKLWLEQKLIGLPNDVHSLHYVDADSMSVVASTNDDVSGQPLGVLDAPWTGDAATLATMTESTLSAPYRVEGHPVVAFVAPVAGRNGFVVLTTSLDARSNAFESPIATGDIKVLSADGTILLDNRKASLLEAYAGADGVALDEVEAALTGRSGYKLIGPRTGMEAGEYAMAYAPIAGTDWVLTYHVPADRAFALQTNVQQSLLLLVGIVLVGFASVGVLLRQNTIKPLRSIAAKMRALERGDLDIDLETTRIDEFGDVVAGAVSLRDSLRNRNRDAQRISETMERAGDGDFTVRMTAESDTEDMDRIVQAFNGMMDDVGETLATVQRFGDDVAALSEEVTASATEVSKASEQVSGSVQQIAEGSDEQSDRLATVANEMNDMSAAVQQIASSADELVEFTKRATEKGDHGKDAATEALTGIDAIQTETDNVVTEIEDLDRQMSEIGAIIEVITDIAEQTNILALNANIEAARAGEAGEGFAVVSHEVKSLAEKTKESAEQIERLINGLQSQQRDVIAGMDRMRDRVADGSESVDRALVSLDDIVAEIEETNASVEEINAATSSQAASAQDVLSMTDDVASISEETTAEAQNVAAAAEEQTSALMEVTQSVGDLSSHAQDLEALLARFVVDRATTGPDASIASGDNVVGGVVAPDGGSNTD